MSQTIKLPYQNLVIIAGRLVKDPHPLSAKGDRVGSAVTLAVNRYMKGKPVISTFVDATAWGELAQSMNTYLKKGSAVLITGSLSEYASNGGAKKLQVSIQACQFLSRDEAPEGAEAGE